MISEVNAQVSKQIVIQRSDSSKILLDDEILSCVDRALLDRFGQRLAKTVYWHLKWSTGLARNEITVKPDDFEKALDVIFRASSVSVKKAIAEEIMKQFKLPQTQFVSLAQTIRDAAKCRETEADATKLAMFDHDMRGTLATTIAEDKSTCQTSIEKTITVNTCDEGILSCVDTGLESVGRNVKNVTYWHLWRTSGLRKIDIPEKPMLFVQGLRTFYRESSIGVERAITEEINAVFDLNCSNSTDLVAAIFQARSKMTKA